MCLNERLGVSHDKQNMWCVCTATYPFVAVGIRQPDRQGYTMGYVNWWSYKEQVCI